MPCLGSVSSRNHLNDIIRSAGLNDSLPDGDRLACLERESGSDNRPVLRLVRIERSRAVRQFPTGHVRESVREGLGVGHAVSGDRACLDRAAVPQKVVKAHEGGGTVSGSVTERGTKRFTYPSSNALAWEQS